MIAKKFFLQPLAVAALLLSAGGSQAAFINTFTTLAAFNAATVQQGTDRYTGLSIDGSTPSPLARTTEIGTIYNYTADAAPAGLFFGGGTFANPFLSSNTATDTITINGFSPAIRAIGGNFFGSDVGGAFTSGDMTLVFTDSLGATLTQTITGATQTSFRGVLSDGFITSLTVTSVQTGAGFIWPSADNLVMAIPEPGTYALMLAGLGLVGFMARRRRA